jgi:hypothetical protein
MSVQLPSDGHLHDLGQASLGLPLPHPRAWTGTTQALGFSRKVLDAIAYDVHIYIFSCG